MGNIKMLDCTLRDGAYIVDGQFGANAIFGIIKRLGEANVEIIECGWLKNTIYVDGSSYYHMPKDLETFLGEQKKKGVIYTAMIDWDRYNLTQLPENNGRAIDAIRIVFPRGRGKQAIPLGKIVQKKGYKVFFQAANTLGYSNEELKELVEEINLVKPEGLSIVDTFGAMYEEDLRRIVSTVNECLDPSISLGLHSHNNMQQSFSLSMSFVKMMASFERNIIVDASLSGMGRGAGNAPTELVASYLNKFWGKNYDMNTIIDIIDVYMAHFAKNYVWGYSTPYFLSGIYCSHVNNIAYLTKNHKTCNKDIKQILEALPESKRLVYDYELLEEKYIEYQKYNINDEVEYEHLRRELKGKDVLLIAPGINAELEQEKVCHVENRKNIVTIGVNAVMDGKQYDYLFFTNAVRLEYALETHKDIFNRTILLLTSNLHNLFEETMKEYDVRYINYNDLIKRGWVHFDNSVIMCLRMLDRTDIVKIYIAGFDGYAVHNAYADPVLQTRLTEEEIALINKEIEEMLEDFIKHKATIETIKIITSSVYSIG